MSARSWSLFAMALSAAALCCTASTAAQSSNETGKLKIHVQPKQAYVFVDGKAIRDGSQTIDLAAGAHQVEVTNYGYLPQTQTVHIGAGETTDLRVALQSSGDVVEGPFADIEFKGDPRAAVLLNGTTPEYFVGHVDEFDWNWLWHQRLLVKPGTYNVNVTREGRTIWSGPVTAKAGQQITVYLDKNGLTKTKDWKEGLTMPPQPRFHAGIASATVPIAPVAAQLAAQNKTLACGESTDLNWKTVDAADTSISGVGKVPSTGEHSVSPTQSTTYTLTAKGPGGVITQTVTVDVNTQPTATLALSQPEVRYHKIGDKVVEQDAATLQWSATNANSARLDPFGSEAMSGSERVMAVPKQTSDGPIDENVTYTLTTANACGGTTTKTATLHVVGSIDPPPPITLASMFYPTAWPTRRHPDAGLVASEKAQLKEIARHFLDHQQYDAKATLMIVGHADVRGSARYNQALSERRARLVRDYLVANGVPADKIKTEAKGKTDQLQMKKVEELQANDPQKPEKWMAKNEKTTWLAYNRRADVILEPKNQASTEMYPNDVADAKILWQRPEPSWKKIEAAAKMPSAGTSSMSASASTGGN